MLILLAIHQDIT